MKNYVLLLITIAGLFGSSCYKNPPPPLSYGIDPLTNAYVPNNDSVVFPVLVKFFTGNTNETVWVTIEGLPTHVTMKQDTITGTPTFTAAFVLYANNATLGYYPVTLVSYSKTTGIKRTSFTLGVVTANCATALAGTYSGSNTCSSANYTYSLTASYAGTDSLNLVNFGGYGSITTTGLRLNCSTDSISVPSQNIGNGVTVSGKGYFTANQMVISYTALNTPGGFNDTCTAIISR